jgi:lauroyl/myristoyl acyltransferase
VNINTLQDYQVAALVASQLMHVTRVTTTPMAVYNNDGTSHQELASYSVLAFSEESAVATAERMVREMRKRFVKEEEQPEPAGIFG